MVSEAPPFWWEKSGWAARALSPLGWIYGRIAGRRMDRARRWAAPVPVLCVGNFTVGGAGKTPTAIAIARAACGRGLKPGFLSRGYGGSLDVTTLVDPQRHRALEVGDEPLLLARAAATVISRKRVEGAQRLVAEGVDLIIMDDGFQSARLVFDYALLVIDSRRGIGNGHLVPAGPVRAPLAQQLRHASALLKIGRDGAADPVVRTAARAGKGVFVADIVHEDDGSLRGRRVLAFAGIADPEKFYRTVRATGAEIVVSRDFPDHHHLDEDEIASLLDDADASGLLLVTTAKDRVRLDTSHGTGHPGSRVGDLAREVRVIDVDIVFDDPAAPDKMIDAALAAARRRLLRRSGA
ncbi:tetraacyldisaccharide 4'-kinase [Rhizobium sp. Leaf384]|uniref:tetraacyldisaccharide 4'-kinase n=1 Tax=unclassified Rhizobium TaxID=2613769 RepID=UPI000714DE06|nr:MULTISPECIES: tetraacyldisaccharide 4'-kinase [unclassified Rhizobium]KQS77298.1 tetraacyldisaccharide 4'-kinase [Rhizobium sp. Leaf383]KQS80780.1 tetraacyldisaccharide 4'-kinase [Rhizobium sp. Leaf384]